MPTEKQSTSAAGSPTTSTDKTKKKPRGGLLACLNCFAPKDTGAHEDDTEEAAKRTTRINKAPRTAQTAPVQKAEPSAADTSTADSKDAVEEKDTGGMGHASGAVLSAPSQDMRPDVTRDNVSAQPLDGLDGGAPQTTSFQDTQPIDTTPAPVQHPPRLDTNIATPLITTQGPTPVGSPDERISPEAASQISDRTSEQEVKDAEIEDKPAAVPMTPAEATEIQQQDEKRASMDIDPTTAAVVPGSTAAATAMDRGAAQPEPDIAPPQPEPEKVRLLPPIRPEFVGKKCLVLDLDETLVHSSFKVCPRSTPPFAHSPID